MEIKVTIGISDGLSAQVDRLLEIGLAALGLDVPAKPTAPAAKTEPIPAPVANVAPVVAAPAAPAETEAPTPRKRKRRTKAEIEAAEAASAAQPAEPAKPTLPATPAPPAEPEIDDDPFGDKTPPAAKAAKADNPYELNGEVWPVMDAPAELTSTGVGQALGGMFDFLLKAASAEDGRTFVTEWRAHFNSKSAHDLPPDRLQEAFDWAQDRLASLITEIKSRA